MDAFVIRGFSIDPQTQVGFYGSSDQLLQQRMSDLEGRLPSLRWLVTIHPLIGTGQTHQPLSPLYGQPLRRVELCEFPPCHPKDMESD
jgi:hypothetical protein